MYSSRSHCVPATATMSLHEPLPHHHLLDYALLLTWGISAVFLGVVVWRAITYVDSDSVHFDPTPPSIIQFCSVPIYGIKVPVVPAYVTVFGAIKISLRPLSGVVFMISMRNRPRIPSPEGVGLLCKKTSWLMH